MEEKTLKLTVSVTRNGESKLSVADTCIEGQGSPADILVLAEMANTAIINTFHKQMNKTAVEVFGEDGGIPISKTAEFYFDALEKNIIEGLQKSEEKETKNE